jgi:hypothetical protein
MKGVVRLRRPSASTDWISSPGSTRYPTDPCEVRAAGLGRAQGNCSTGSGPASCSRQYFSWPWRRGPVSCSRCQAA